MQAAALPRCKIRIRSSKRWGGQEPSDRARTCAIGFAMRPASFSCKRTLRHTLIVEDHTAVVRASFRLAIAEHVFAFFGTIEFAIFFAFHSGTSVKMLHGFQSPLKGMSMRPAELESVKTTSAMEGSRFPPLPFSGSPLASLSAIRRASHIHPLNTKPMPSSGAALTN